MIFALLIPVRILELALWSVKASNVTVFPPTLVPIVRHVSTTLSLTLTYISIYKWLQYKCLLYISIHTHMYTLTCTCIHISTHTYTKCMCAHSCTCMQSQVVWSRVYFNEMPLEITWGYTSASKNKPKPVMQNLMFLTGWSSWPQSV